MKRLLLATVIALAVSAQVSAGCGCNKARKPVQNKVFVVADEMNHKKPHNPNLPEPMDEEENDEKQMQPKMLMCGTSPSSPEAPKNGDKKNNEMDEEQMPAFIS